MFQKWFHLWFSKDTPLNLGVSDSRGAIKIPADKTFLKITMILEQLQYLKDLNYFLKKLVYGNI